MSAYRRFPAPDPDGLRELRALVAFDEGAGAGVHILSPVGPFLYIVG